MQGSRLTTKSERDALAKKIKDRMSSFERSTLGGECKTPGLKTRSKGRGRGLAKGRGRGPLGIPFGYK